MKKTAYCKVNLTLEILGTKRDDGFHDLKSVMHKIPLGDVIDVSAKEGNGIIDFVCDSDVCAPADNLAYRAADMYLDLYRKNTGKDADIKISLKKVTPTGAGLGGGSADAACVLDILQKELCGVSEDETLELAKKLGSDVPFCLERYMSAYCTGRGEICRIVDTLPENVYLVVAKPKESINTKGIYGEYDKKFGDDYSKCVSDKMEKALKENNLSQIGANFVNDFESVCIPRLPAIDGIKKYMLDSGAVASQMSGSGSAVFGLFDNEQKSVICHDGLKLMGLSEVFCFTPLDFEKMYKGE